MRKNLFIICFFLLYSSFSFAQVKRPTQFMYGDLSYGYENNLGNSGLLLGIGYQRTLDYKFILQADFHYFDSEIINANWAMSEPSNVNTASDHNFFIINNTT